MEIFSPNTIGYTLLGYLIGTFITGSTIVIVLKCIFPKGIGSARSGTNTHYRNGSRNKYSNDRRNSDRRNSFLSSVFFLLMAFIAIAYTMYERNNESGNNNQVNWQDQESLEGARQYQPGQFEYKAGRSGAPASGQREQRYYASSLATVSIGNWNKQANVPAPDKADVPSRIFIQKPASPNREIAGEEAKDWAFNLHRPVSLAFDPGSSSTPYKILLGPYSSREEAEADKKGLQIEGLVLDISQKGWKVFSAG